MPRFLDTFTGEFVWSPDPRMVPYAILSHTWRPESGGGEQSYNEVTALQRAVDAKCRQVQERVIEELKRLELWKPSLLTRTRHRALPPPTNFLACISSILSHPHLSDKIKCICRVARAAGYRLLWIDSNCIDKSSSAELSEAINSMYEWYRLADVCYVYLADVPDGEDPTLEGSHFRRSRWHRRGWTLQELIAPERVVFLSSAWCFLGTRTGLASTLEDITRVDFDVLTGRVALSSISVARRMSWAARRETTRVEDRAYSLLGIFGVHMSPIYGEGTNAFLRLQEEVIRTIPDQSVFAWGRTRTLASLDREGSHDYWALCAPGLLAASPWDFLDAHDVVTLSPAEFALRLRRAEDDIPPLHCLFTPQGVRVQLLCIDLTRAPHRFRSLFLLLEGGTCDDCLRLGRADTLALLQCEDHTGALIALPLFRQRPGSQCRKYGAPRAVTTISTHGWCGKMSGGHGPVHLVRLARGALSAALEHLLPHPTEVSLLPHPSEPPLPKSRQRGIVLERRIDLWNPDPDEAPVFHIAPTCVDDLAALGFAVSPLLVERSERAAVVTALITSDPAHRSWLMGTQQTIRLELTLTGAGSLDNTTEACFSVSTHVYRAMIPPDVGRGPSHGASPSSDLLVQLEPRPGPALSEARCPDDSGGRRMLRFSTRETSERVVAEAEFVIHANADWDADVFDLRMLRVRLERPAGGGGVSADPKNLWLSVDVSEKYKCHRPLNGTAVSSERVLVDVKSPISDSECKASTSSGGGSTSQVANLNVIHCEAGPENKPPHDDPTLTSLPVLTYDGESFTSDKLETGVNGGGAETLKASARLTERTGYGMHRAASKGILKLSAHRHNAESAALPHGLSHNRDVRERIAAMPSHTHSSDDSRRSDSAATFWTSFKALFRNSNRGLRRANESPQVLA